VIAIGIFAKTFPGNDPLTVLGSVREAGYRVAHYNMACSGLASLPDAIPAEAAEAVAAAVRDTGVSLAGVSATYNMIHPDPAVRQAGQDSLAAIAAAAHAMRVRLLTLCTGTRDPHDPWRRHPANDAPEAWRDLLAAMELAIAAADGHDVDLGIEPERGNVISSALKARRLLDEMQSPRLRIVLDPANLVETEPAAEKRRIIAEAIDLLADRIVMAHAKDRIADGRFAAAGKGVLDYPHYLRCLVESGFDGPLVAHGLDPAEAPPVARFLSEALAEARLA
jgi:sugar phosphate isomerase/epimerase